MIESCLFRPIHRVWISFQLVEFGDEFKSRIVKIRRVVLNHLAIYKEISHIWKKKVRTLNNSKNGLFVGSHLNWIKNFSKSNSLVHWWKNIFILNPSTYMASLGVISPISPRVRIPNAKAVWKSMERYLKIRTIEDLLYVV